MSWCHWISWMRRELIHTAMYWMKRDTASYSVRISIRSRVWITWRIIVKCIREMGADVEVIFANQPQEILKYTKNVLSWTFIPESVQNAS